MTAHRAVLVKHLSEILSIADIPDSSCNGLQVEGAEIISVVGLAVDASLAVYKKAIAKKCQLLIVHHGIIWNGLTSITGSAKRQIEYLLKHRLNLYAAHLPLDSHPEYGNNIGLAKLLGLSDISPFGAYKGRTIGFKGKATRTMTVDEIGAVLRTALGGAFSSLPFGKRKNGTIAMVSGGGSQSLPEAIEQGIDCFVTGEPDHRDHHLALEAGINVVYGGHYHTEKLGVMSLGRHLEKKFGIKTVFIDEPTLV
jgi:dinuclear metal center YbgI/SA1388 family protein